MKLIDNLWQLVLMAGAVTLVVLFIFWITVDKPTIRYSLSSNSKGTPIIVREIEWADDDFCPLNDTTSYEEAVVLVEKLNKELKTSKH